MTNEPLARSHGINTVRARQLTFIVGAALAGFAGALLGPIQGIDPNFGATAVATAFLAVLLSGRTLPGLVLSCVLLGATQTLFARYENAVWANAVVIGLAVVILRFRPRGARIPTRLNRRRRSAGAASLVAIVLLALAPLALGTYYLSLLTSRSSTASLARQPRPRLGLHRDPRPRPCAVVRDRRARRRDGDDEARLRRGSCSRRTRGSAAPRAASLIGMVVAGAVACRRRARSRSRSARRTRSTSRS